MAVREFSRVFAKHLATQRKLSRVRKAGEADPLNAPIGGDDPTPIEHTSPEDVSPGEPEDGDSSYEEEIRHVDPEWSATADLADEPDDGVTPADTTARVAALHDELAQPDDQPQEQEQPLADGPPGSDHGKPRSPIPETDKAQTGEVPTNEKHPDSQTQPGQERPGAPPPSDGSAQHPPPPAAGGGAEPEAPAPQEGDQVFDFVEGLDPVSRGKLVNDWQEAVDPKLFSKHTNVLSINQKGNTVTLQVQAFNTDSGTQPSINSGYAVDGIERGELMQHLREIFQPNGPAVSHVANVYNGFIETQADLGKMQLMRLKVTGSQFRFSPEERTIEGWADAGLGREPKWQKTPYTVYVVDFYVTFGKVGAGAQPTAPAQRQPAPAPGAHDPAQTPAKQPVQPHGQPHGQPQQAPARGAR